MTYRWDSPSFHGSMHFRGCHVLRTLYEVIHVIVRFEMHYQQALKSLITTSEVWPGFAFFQLMLKFVDIEHLPP
jgi:hypothetical protein